MELTVAALAEAGVRDAESVAHALGSVADRLRKHPADAVLAGLHRAADPRAAAMCLADLLNGEVFDGVPDIESLLVVLGGSPSLAASLAAEGAGWPKLLHRVLDVPVRSVADHRAALLEAGRAEGSSLPDLQRLLRRHCRQEMLRIGGRDLTGLADVDQTVREVSALAEGVVEAALELTQARLEAQWGIQCPVPIVVFGMGKLGGEELNYSSDIDLVFVYDRDEPITAELTAREFLVRLAEEVTKTLAEVTDDGRCFRVDLRLRPGGGEGPLAISVAALLDYYESWGQTWERAVWLKARPVAGDETLGRRVLQALEPFVYRRYLDFGTLDDLYRMRRRVDSSLRDADRRRRDVKLGHGGIREVEFVVQARQLIHGGKDQRIRALGSVAALRRLIDAGYVEAEEGARLIAAYRFLRDVEHKIQIVHQLQTQTIPRDPEEEERLARRLGFDAADPVAAFWTTLNGHTTIVHAAFDALFGDAGQAADEAHPELLALFDDRPEADDPRATLAALGFRDESDASRHLQLLRDGPAHAPASPRRRQAMQTLGPTLLAEIGRSGAPDRALALMAEFVATVGARTSYLQLLEKNPATMRLLVRLFAGSEFLSRFFLRHPELLDDLVRVDLVRIVRGRDELAAELTDRLAAAPDLEIELDVIRRFRHEEFLRIGIHDLDGGLSGTVVERQLSDLADVCLDAAVTIARREVCRQTGVAETEATAALVTIALGKLGGRELNYHSDLDLVFVWNVPEDQPWPGPRDPQDFFTRVVQRTISILQTPTREGRAYQIDTRLRPSGNQGTLVTSIAAFDAYHHDGAAIWERQALIKARTVLGPPALRAALSAVIDRRVYGRGLEAHDVADLQRLRRRIEAERGDATDIKTGEGGVIDVEFAVHLVQLRFGHEHRALRTPSIREALEAIAAVSVVPVAVTGALRDGYEFLRALENRLRIERDQPVSVVRDDVAVQLALARRLGYGGSDALAVEELGSDLARHRYAIRAAYDRIIEIVTAP